MKYRVTVELDTTKAVFEQVTRNGLQLVREGDGLTVKVPNRTLRQCKVTLESIVKEEKPAG